MKGYSNMQKKNRKTNWKKKNKQKSSAKPFSVLHKYNEEDEVCMEVDSVVFMDSSSSDHLL